MNSEKKKLGLYIHIPFCVKKCDYCDFLSSPASEETKETYVKALIAEIKSYQALASEYLVKSIFIGGGTPSSIESKHIVAIMETIYKVFRMEESYIQTEINENDDIMKKEMNVNPNIKIDKEKIDMLNMVNSKYESTNNIESNIEITIEINPGTITKEKLLDYKKAGINRLSFGLQSTNNQELKMLGRIHTYEEFEQNYTLARELGFHNINIDLMSALPGQTLDSWLANLNQVIKLNPEHISAYSLIIEEETPFYNRYSEEDQNEELDREIYKQTKDCLEKAGYNRYEISNYSKLGYECKHNTSYWTRDNYLGLGLGASSLIENTRYHNEEQLTTYIKLAKEPDQIKRDKQSLTIQQQMEEFMFLGLRLTKGINTIKFKNTFQEHILDVFGEPINKSIKEGLLIQKGEWISLTEKGLDLSNIVMSRFLLD